MRRFHLPDDALVALGAGRPGAETLTELRKAQLSRHLLRLSEIVRAVSPGWYATSPTRAELADPMTGLYATTALTALRAGSTPPDRPQLLPPTGRTLAVTCDGLTLRVRLEDGDPLRGRLGLTPAGRLSAAEVAHWRQCLDDAWRILVRRHRPDASTLAAVLRVIVPVEPDPAAGGISATSADAFGAVAMSAPADGLALAVGLLHETQHSILNGVRALFDLVRPDGKVGYSPWRDDPRPAFGLLHGAYAYLSVTRFWRAESKSRAGRRAEFEYARWRAAVVAAGDDLLGGDALTAAGRRLTGALRDEAAGWLDDPVDPEVARWAAGANAEHRACWRLRHLTVDPAALVQAWRTGSPPPAMPEPAVRPAAGRELATSARLARMHELLRGSEGDQGLRPGGGVRPGDDAYLGGDLGAAHEAYLKGLDWIGLAVVSPNRIMRERPELVAAAYNALGGGELAALLRWIPSVTDRRHR